MSWMQALQDTYDNYYAGPIQNKGTAPLPVGFTIKKIDIQVYLDSDSTFHEAKLSENNRIIAVPSTPEAEGKTGSTPVPYPLFDEIRYVGSDLSAYTNKDYTPYAKVYISKLEQWQCTEDAPEALRILYSYLQKGTLVKDILEFGTITLDKNGLFPEDFIKKRVEFYIYDANKLEFISIVEMPEVRESWKNYLASSMKEIDFSYASGEMEPICRIHPAVIDTAKLISSKIDGNEFKFKGRFCDAEQACMVGYLSSSKIHNTLKWLMQKQGLQRYGMYFLSWNVQCREIRIYENDDDDISQVEELDTDYAFAEALNRTILGLQNAPEYQKDSTIAILGMIKPEIVKPGRQSKCGRMSINFWEELDGRTYLERLHHWYASCYFRLYRKNKEDKKYTCLATPTPGEIGCAVFGEDNMQTAESDRTATQSITKQVRRLRMDLMSCVYDQKTIPYPYVQAAYHRVLNPLRFTKKDKKTTKWSRWEWERALSITLAMLKNVHKNKEEYQLSLNVEEKDRSYLFGRLTAIADVVEWKATTVADRGNDRQTNAVRYFSAMQQRPATTWANLRSRLEPYFAKFQSIAVREYYRRMLDTVYALGEDGALSDNTPLTPRFLEGYHNQRYALIHEGKIKKEN